MGYKSWVSCKIISCSQLVHRFKQSNRDNDALPPCKDDLIWPLGWDSHGKCISVYGSTLDKACDE